MQNKLKYIVTIHGHSKPFYSLTGLQNNRDRREHVTRKNVMRYNILSPYMSV